MSSSIALIAHDSKKNEIVVLAKKYYSILARYNLIATSATGQKIEQEAGLSVNQVKSSSEGVYRNWDRSYVTKVIKLRDFGYNKSKTNITSRIKY